MIIIFEGPEKTGKTTLIARLKTRLIVDNYSVIIRKFSGPMTNEDQYLVPLRDDASRPWQISLWDRGWVSEHIYSTYFDRTSTLNCDDARAEKVFTSIVDKFGLKYIVLPFYMTQLETLRDSSDLAIPPSTEYSLFSTYARWHHWEVLVNNYTKTSLEFNCDRVIADIEKTK